MKKLIIISLILFCSVVAAAQTGTIVVNVTKGIENDKGVVQIGIYNNADDFPVYDKNTAGALVEASTSGISYTFTDIPAGTYAVAVWHDEDKDSAIDKNIFGAPTENYGFSRNVYGTFGPPAFSDVSFEVRAGKKMTLTIYLR